MSKFNTGIVQSMPSGGGGGYDPDAVALFARMSPSPSTPRKTTINTLIVALKAANLWTKLDVLKLYAADGAANSLLNWISTSYNSTNATGTSFTTDRGYTGNGSSTFLYEGGYQPGSGQFASSSHSFGVWARTVGASNGAYMGATDTGTGLGNSITILNPVSSLSYIDSNPSPDTGITAPAGLQTISRLSGSTYSAYTNASLVSAYTRNYLIIPTGTGGFATLANMTDGSPTSFSNSQISAAFMGSGLSGPDVANLYPALQAYMTDVGAYP